MGTDSARVKIRLRLEGEGRKNWWRGTKDCAGTWYPRNPAREPMVLYAFFQGRLPTLYRVVDEIDATYGQGTPGSWSRGLEERKGS